MNEGVDMVVVLIEQHRTLQKYLSDAKKAILEKDLDLEKITHSLQLFAANLSGHLQLEDQVFYPELLSLMKSKGADVSDTKKFIKEMEQIGAEVAVFLKKYQELDDLKKNLVSFSMDIDNIIQTLNIRIESEESGIYDYWEIYR